MRDMVLFPLTKLTLSFPQKFQDSLKDKLQWKTEFSEGQNYNGKL